MNVIHVNFVDRDYLMIQKKVTETLQASDLIGHSTIIPVDAIACALDEVEVFHDDSKRTAIMEKLELHFAQLKP
ncbi:MAG: hypothetical protein HRU19_03875 [Pseudobacteriovorax sp.]|nr:hypothetical protein [Pseudobacteriovorax sp.]